MVRNNKLLFYAGLTVMIYANGMDNDPMPSKFNQKQVDIFSFNQTQLLKAADEEVKKQNDEEFATDYRCRVFNTQQLLKLCEKKFEKRRVEKDKQLTRR